MDAFFIFCARYLHVFSIMLALIFLLTQQSKVRSKIVLYACVCLVLSYLIALVIGHLFYNPRPFVEHHFKPLVEHEVENGLPSHHALLVSSIAVIITRFNKRLAILFWIFALFVGIARVYVGVHHAVDVATSFLISISVGIIASADALKNSVNSIAVIQDKSK